MIIFILLLLGKKFQKKRKNIQFIFLGPQSQYFIINNLESNRSFSFSTKPITQSSSKNILTIKKTGLVGDICIKVTGDCSKYMECKKQNNNILSNFSTCQCIDGYIADSDRTCSKKYHFFF